MELKDTVAVVTGGAHGIGRALCQALHAEGARVAVADLDYQAAQRVARDVAGLALAITHGDAGIRVCLVCPQAVATRMTGFDDDGEKVQSTVGFGGNDVDGILSAEHVAGCIVAGIQQERFLVLPHPQVATYFRRKAEDHDRWIGGMQRFRRKLPGDKT